MDAGEKRQKFWKRYPGIPKDVLLAKEKSTFLNKKNFKIWSVNAKLL